MQLAARSSTCEESGVVICLRVERGTSPRARSRLDYRFQQLRPVREVFERRRVGVIELEGRDGDRAVADGRKIGVRFDVFDALLFVQPEIFAAARVGAG